MVLIFYISPRFGQSNILVYISICSLLGSFTVSSVKGLGIAIRTMLSDLSVVRHPLTWILLLTLIGSIIIQVNYLNKSLDTFNTLLVYPIYYVFFTTVVLSTSVILFKEWGAMSGVDVVGTIGGFLVIVIGVSMLHLFKDLNVSFEDLRSNLFQPDSPLKREDKHILIENIESLPPMREEGPRVFIISWDCIRSQLVLIQFTLTLNLNCWFICWRLLYYDAVIWIGCGWVWWWCRFFGENIIWLLLKIWNNF